MGIHCVGHCAGIQNLAPDSRSEKQAENITAQLVQRQRNRDGIRTRICWSKSRALWFFHFCRYHHFQKVGTSEVLSDLEEAPSDPPTFPPTNTHLCLPLNFVDGLIQTLKAKIRGLGAEWLRT